MVSDDGAPATAPIVKADAPCVIATEPAAFMSTVATFVLTLTAPDPAVNDKAPLETREPLLDILLLPEVVKETPPLAVMSCESAMEPEFAVNESVEAPSPIAPEVVMAFAVAFPVVSEREAGEPPNVIVEVPSLTCAEESSTMATLPEVIASAPLVARSPEISLIPAVDKLMPPFAVKVPPIDMAPLVDV
jgi:hypothetical protein